MAGSNALHLINHHNNQNLAITQAPLKINFFQAAVKSFQAFYSLTIQSCSRGKKRPYRILSNILSNSVKRMKNNYFPGNTYCSRSLAFVFVESHDKRPGPFGARGLDHTELVIVSTALLLQVTQDLGCLSLYLSLTRACACVNHASPFKRLITARLRSPFRSRTCRSHDSRRALRSKFDSP
ncbi:hypothetical protein ANME2D_00539 [Candidatus Methanoperedens nitroreducens]|uniref:Uncharacterized protein n=1 Tax=Candidatus Methanoperedens nitratireducens TaxID=1392998 RepID=A0A062V338_9EURY|nr:hypothetical protein ANME2D_00539 [Candidatus Methanoperedens nitroreducens]